MPTATQEKLASNAMLIAERQKTFNEQAEAAGRLTWDEEQNAEMDKLLTESEALREQVARDKRVADAQSVMTAEAEQQAEANNAAQETQGQEEAQEGERSRGLLTVGGSNMPGHGGMSASGQAEFLHWVRTGCDAQGSYRPHWDLTFDGKSVANDDRFMRQRALEAGTNSEGGFAVQDEISRLFFIAQYENDALREAGATVVQTRTGASMPYATVTDVANTTAVVAEEGTGSETNPTVGGGTSVAQVYRGYQDVTEELEEDESMGLIAALPQILTARLDRSREDAHTTGAGTGTPRTTAQGVMTALAAETTSRITLANYSAFAVSTLQDVFVKPGRAYRRRGVWMFNTTTMLAIMKLVDGDSRPIWQPSVVGAVTDGVPGRLMNRPYYVNDEMADGGVTASFLAYGDFTYYVIRDVRAVRVTRDTLTQANSGQIRLNFRVRGDGFYINPGNNPIAYIRSTAA